jgi:hypothetical protein
MTTDPRVTGQIAARYNPFDRAQMGTDLSEVSERIGVTAMAEIIRRDSYISYEFTGAERADSDLATSLGYRAISYGAGFTAPGFDWSWMNFITGYVGGLTAGAQPFYVAGSALLLYATIRDWYKWGARKFWLHHPFGRVALGRDNQEAMHYQPDAYYSTKHGCTCPFENKLGNAPMPWLTDDVVAGKTQGFVPLFKALISGSSAGLSEDVWLRLTGTGADRWYDPSDPIEVVGYCGTINPETFRKFRKWFGTTAVIQNTQAFGITGETEQMPANVYARYRLEQSLEPFKRAGMRIAFDALPVAPGPTLGLCATPTPASNNGNRYDGLPDNPKPYEPQGVSFDAADRGWWNFFSEYVLKNWDKKDIFMEAFPGTIAGPSGIGWVENPYLSVGVNVASGDEYSRIGYGGDPSFTPFTYTNSRAHYLSELGEVEYVRSPGWQGQGHHVGTVIGGVTAYNGRYWFLGGGGVEEAVTNQGSLPISLPNPNVDRYLRTKGSYPANVYPGPAIWGGHLYASHFIQRQEQNNDQTTYSEKVKPKVLINAVALYRIDDTTFTNLKNGGFGITNDFWRAYPNITQYAKFVASLHNGDSPMSITKGDYGASYKPYSANFDTTITTEGANAVVSGRIDSVPPVMVLDPFEFDAFAGTNLRGSNDSGFFYTPNPDVDIPQAPLNTWLDIKIRQWKRLFGVFPTYIAWKLTKYNGVPEASLTQFQMERYLMYPASLPTTATETAAAFAVREKYYVKPPVKDGNNLVVTGMQSINQSTPNGDPSYITARNLVRAMLSKTKTWATSRALTGVKVGLYDFPNLPEAIYPVYGLVGGNITLLAQGNWNDKVFPKQNQSPQGGLDGWHTEAATADLKARILLEYRKRLEGVVYDTTQLADFVLPAIYCKSPEELILDDSFQSRKESQRQSVELCHQMRTLPQWLLLSPGSFASALRTAQIFPLVSLSYEGPTAGSLLPGDPITDMRGTVFDEDKINHSMIDWVRDDLFRPIRGRPRKIDGMFIANERHFRALNALRVDSYAGRNEDRNWVYKWLVANDGEGVTIDWSNASDASNKVGQFFGVHRQLAKKHLGRFDRGQPRIDVVDPYRHTPFAITWNTGYENGHPAVIDGMAITDVHPSLFAGFTLPYGLLRGAGASGNIPTWYFNDFVRRSRLLPKGRRVMIPYYWHEDPIGDQRYMVDYYKNTSDGATYGGTLYRTHETTGIVKFGTPWMYNQTADAAASLRVFFGALAATGAMIDYVACDAEAFRTQDLSSVIRAFEGPWGPTGMPAAGTPSNGVQPWESVLELSIPDPRETRTTVLHDPRFSNKVNPFDNLTMKQSIEQTYKDVVRLAPTFQVQIAAPNNPDINGSAENILRYYNAEGPTGISAATGPASVSAYGQPAQTTPLSANPWRAPWTDGQMYQLADLPNNQFVNKYIGWYAYRKALHDIVMGDLIKKQWIDTIAGSTIQNIRKIGYSHYEIAPTGITEGAFALESNRHGVRTYSTFPWIDAAPEFYGELSTDLRDGKYHLFPSNDRERFHVENQTGNGIIQFGSGGTGARSYIAMLKEMSVVRAMLRNKPDSWKRFNPWLTPTIENSFSHGFRQTDINQTEVYNRTNPLYFGDFAFHCLMSGARHINLFHTANADSNLPYPDGVIGPGYSAGIVEMQTILNEWKTKSEGYRIQPVSTVDGSPSTAHERILMVDAGGNHVGATGVFISGGRILRSDIEKRGASGDLNQSHLWRVTAAPQGTKLYRANSGYTADIPPVIDLVSGVVDFVNAQTTPTDEGTFTANIIGGGVVERNAVIGATTGFYISTSPIVASRAGSGVELRHHSLVNPNSYEDVPYIIGSGRPMEFQCVFRQIDNPLFDPNFYNAVPDSKGSISFVGFYNTVPAFENHSTGYNIDGTVSSHATPPYGIKSAIGFFQQGGSFLRTMVAWYDSAKEEYKQSAVQHDGNAAYADNELRIEIEPDGSAVRFYNNNILLRSVTAGTQDAQGISIRIPKGADLEAVGGLWAGAFVRDLTLSPLGSPAGVGGPEKIFIQSGAKPTKFIVSRNENDAEVSTSYRGAWIKRKRPQRPVYKIDPRRANASTDPAYLEPGTGFPANPDSLFTADPTEATPASELADFSDLRVIAAWKDDPIPFDPVPESDRVTVIAYHPSGIRRVEATLNGGMTASLTGTAGVAYGEFTFRIPPVSGANLPFPNLAKTLAGAPYSGYHQIRAKVFPFTGKTRILGGEPGETSRYYPPLADNPLVKKREANETSFFIQNINTATDPRYKKISVNPLIANSAPQSGVYGQRLIDGILANMNTNNVAVTGAGMLDGSGGGIRYLDIELFLSDGNVNLPSGDVPTTVTLNSVVYPGSSFQIESAKANDLCVRVSASQNATNNQISIESNLEQDNRQTSLFSIYGIPVNLGILATLWESSISYSKTSNIANSYGLSAGRIYRLNKNSAIAPYNIPFTTISPTGLATNNADWTHIDTQTTLINNILNTRTTSMFGIGKFKLGKSGGASLILSRSPMYELRAKNLDQAYAFEGITFTDAMAPSLSALNWAKNGNISYKNCSTSSTPPRHAFSGARYVIGCTATGVFGSVFGNASFVRDSFATGCHKIDKTNPSFFGRYALTEGNDARAKKNSLYLNTSCNGDFADCIGLGRNEVATANRHNIDHMDILYRGLTFTGQVGIADRIEGYVHNVHIDGLSMPNAIVLSPEYRTSLAANDPARYQKLYIKNSTFRMIMNEGAPSGNELASSGFNYRSEFGVNIAATGVTATIRPRNVGLISLGVRGIPTLYNTLVGGNTLTPMFTVQNSMGLKTFGLDMGGGFGPTASGYQQRGLTFATWSRPTFEGAPLNPRLCWVYGVKPAWTVFSGGGNFTRTNTDYENGIQAGSSGSQFLLSTNLSTFFSQSNLVSPFFVFRANAPSTWGIMRTYAAATDTWAATVNNQSFAQAGTGITGHWLMVGNSGSLWMTNTLQSVQFSGSSAAVAQGRLSFGNFADTSNATRFAEALAVGGGLGGMTLEDQYGNLYKIERGVFTPVSRSVVVEGSQILYISGNSAGQAITSPTILQQMMREWNYNGDATNQYAPINLQINLNNTGIYRSSAF